MSLGFYRVIKGNLAVRPRHSPDGDSMRFIADDMSLFEELPHFSEAVGMAGNASYQLRFQAIDTPELHYGGAVQPHGLESRNGLLKWLGVNSREWDWTVVPEDFEWTQSAAILCDSFDQHGRPIAFIFRDLGYEDGAELKLSKNLLQESYNFHAINSGLAYLGIYEGSLPSQIKNALILAYKKAKSANKGLWQLDRTAEFKVTSLSDLGPAGGALIYPKVFRRCVDALRWAGGEFEPGADLDDFLLAKPNENDRFIVHALHMGKIKSRLSSVIEQINNRIRIQVDLNTVEFIAK